MNKKDLTVNQSKQTLSGEPITFLPQHGHYRFLRVYQITEMIYEIMCAEFQPVIAHPERYEYAKTRTTSFS